MNILTTLFLFDGYRNHRIAHIDPRVKLFISFALIFGIFKKLVRLMAPN